MRKSLLVVFLLVFSLSMVIAADYSELYEMVVPTSYDMLTFEGGLGTVGTSAADNVVEISVGTGTFDLDVAVDGNYYSFDQQLETRTIIDADARVDIGTTNIEIEFDPLINHIQYGLDLGGMDGFWEAGGFFDTQLNISPAPMTLDIEAFPYGGIGIGRVHSIVNVRMATLMMEQLGVIPTVEKVKAVTELFERQDSMLNQYTEDRSKLLVAYWQELADVMGIPGRAMEILYIGSSPMYAFEAARIANMVYGWDARARLSTFINKAAGGGWNYAIDLDLIGQYADFFMDNMLYLEADGDVNVEYSPTSATPIDLNIDVNGRVVYLPEDYHWWAEADTYVGYSSVWVTPFFFSVQGEGHYLMNPNLEVYAGLRIASGATGGMDIYAGGEFRLW